MIKGLTILRFFAAISIVIFHYGRKLFTHEILFIQNLLNNSNVAVSLFFILSGFVLYISYKDKSNLTFYRFLIRRIARIVPVSYLSIIILFSYYIYNSIEIVPLEIVLNVTFMQSYFPEYALSFNTPNWSLSVEFLFYLTFPLILNYLTPRNISSFGWLIFILFIASQITFLLGQNELLNNSNFFYYFPILHLNEFLVGIFSAIIYKKQEKLKLINPLYSFLIILGILLILGFTNTNYYHNGLLSPIFAILLISISNFKLKDNTLTELLIFLGEISFSIYILQKPIYFWMVGILKSLSVSNPFHVFLIYILVLIITSAVVYKYVEMPSKSFLIKKLTK